MKPRRALGFASWATRSAAGTVLVLLGASLALFAVVRASPGDAAASLGLQTPSRQEGAGELREHLGLRAPLLVQYGRWVFGAVRGDFGESAALQRGRPVAELLWPAARRSFLLAGGGLGLSSLAALALAGLRVARPRGRAALWTGALAHFLSAIPVFLFAYIAVAGGNSVLAWGARQGFWSLPDWFPFPSREAWAPWLLASSLLALGDGLFLDLYQRFRVELEHASTGEYLVGARALGLSIPLIVIQGFLPGVASHLSRRLSFVLGSTVVLESALGWPGMGYLAWRAAAERDTPVLLGVALLLALAVRLTLVLADGIRYAADPRSRTQA